MEPRGSAAWRAAGNQTKEERAVVKRMTDACWAPAASLLLPTSLHSPQGSDQKAHAIPALFCFKKAVNKEGKGWEVWQPPLANMSKMKLKASFPSEFNSLQVMF